MSVPHDHLERLARLSSQVGALQQSDLEPLNATLRDAGIIAQAGSSVRWIQLLFQLLPLVLQIATGGFTPALIQSLLQLVSQWLSASTQHLPPSS